MTRDEFVQNPTSTPHAHVLVVGASRGLGHAIVETYLRRGARVVATQRNDGPSLLTETQRAGTGQLAIDRVDITSPEQLETLRARLDTVRFDLLFVVAGISLAPQDAVGADIAEADFELMMATNVLGVMRAVEVLQDLVHPAGTIAVMSSGQGSVSGNSTGGFEVYRATKAALNQMFRSYAARHVADRRAMLLMAPGWVKTELGGPDAMLDIDESIHALVDTVDHQHGTPGLQYLDRHGKPVAW